MEKDKVPLKSKIAYGGLGAGIGLPNQIAFSAITFFYNILLGLDAKLIGIAWLIFSFWNAINDPHFWVYRGPNEIRKIWKKDTLYTIWSTFIWNLVYFLLDSLRGFE